MNYTAVVADDHPIFRKGLIDILKDIPNLRIVEEVSDGQMAYNSIINNKPDLAILDIEMPFLSGIEVCKRVMIENTNTKCIVLTMHREKDYFLDAMNIGVMGYLLKDNAITELIHCVTTVLKGESFISPGLENTLINTESINVAELKSLTATEKVVLRLIADSKTSSEIAGLLFISPNTVDNHRSNIVKKLKLEGKNSLLKFAIQHKKFL